MNDNKNAKCAVCDVEYAYHKELLPIWIIFWNNKLVLTAFFAQVIIPVAIYTALYFQGVLHRLSWYFILAHMTLLGVMYWLFAVQFLSGIELYKRFIQPQSDSNDLEMTGTGNNRVHQN